MVSGSQDALANLMQGIRGDWQCVYFLFVVMLENRFKLLQFDFACNQ